MENHSGRNRHLVVLLFWILVSSIFFYFSYHYIRASMNDAKLAEYLTHAVDLAASRDRPPKEVRDLILVNAEELGLPIQGDQIKITGRGANMNVSVSYEVDFSAPFSDHVLYRKIFQHDVKYHSPY